MACLPPGAPNVTVLITGETGFVGGALMRRLRADSRPALAACRSGQAASMPWPAAEVGDIGPETDWRRTLTGVDCVVHLAARVHVMRERAVDPLAEFRKVNVGGTARLARQAAAAGVRRLVFVSSIKVHGEHSAPGQPCRPQDPLAPADAYARSKHEAELELRRVAADTGMEVVIVRPPLVYGPGVKGNFRRLAQLARYAVPLPLGAVDNRRSLIALDNLVDFIAVCVDHPAAANQALLVSDGQDVSTPQLYRRLGKAFGRTTRLPALPVALLRAAATALGRQAAWQRLCGTLQADDSQARARLDWRPPIDLDEGLRRLARHMTARNPC
jgi:nucleoside-diphosphate-sugar epimerase